MEQILLGKATEKHMDWDALYGMYRLRHTVFHERMGWDVETYDGLERDAFDDIDPVYMVARAGRRQINACWRILPTEGPYMLKDTFPELLRGEPAPQAPDVWELSRFAVTPTSSDDCRQANFSGVTFKMMRNVLDFARDRGIRSYVTVTSVSLERMLRKTGIPLRRLGDGKAQRIGKVLSVACHIDVNEDTRRAVGCADLNTQPVSRAA